MPRDDSNWRGGNFLHVRVAIDVSELLCRGRRVEFDEDDEDRMSFTYERLPNLCYWCGLLMHDEKDCAIWLRSKGSLSRSDQQFGPWIRADQFNPAKKFVVEVRGYERSKSKQTHSEGMGTSKLLTVQSKSQEPFVMVDSDANSGRVVVSEGLEKMGQPQSLENFQAVLQEIDEAIHGDNVVQNPKQLAVESSLNLGGMDAGLKGPVCMHGTGSSVLSMKEDNYQLGKEVNVECDTLFSPGWSSKSTGKKAKKFSGLGAVSKAQQLTRSPIRESITVGN
uniref:Zinc knuckle CX2CX4HX4C domain-containing protein n=1 Tax=Quercus lobata TaxID=97700 RepID=A0A7N2MTA8_QUELO